KSEPLIDWRRAVHPLLRRSLESQGKHVVPLDIELRPESRILVISGPNAGGKSVCLKTVGLLQYMVQCGLSVPMSEHSTMGLFRHLMLDMGDEQSIEDDLSTYSSHLTNMKQMIRQSSDRTLLLIDEFGTGTEPQIGGAIAEAVLRQFHARGSWAVITTHYQNLKHFADSHEGVVNGAMLYDRHEMRPLFQLETGRPGSSFAIEIARKTGLPEEVIRDASEIVGSDYIQSDKYLQDIVRDKRYWEHKRQAIHQQEKQLADRIEHYERVVGEIEGNRKEILRRAKVQAEELLTESNKKIENTIREIREQQAEKEQTRRLREELNAYRDEVSEADNKEADAFIAKKIAQIQARKERKARRKREKEEQQTQAPTPSEASRKTGSDELHEGDTVRMRGQQTVGIIESIQGKTVTAVFGGLRTRLRADQLVLAEQPKTVAVHEVPTSRVTRDTIDEHSKDFRQEIDVRGMRGDEAIDAVMHYIDDAVLMSVGRVRILHGTGSGILRQLIRQYLGTEPNVVNYHDEHVQFGGAGITVVELR
ncbi:MAG: Smr/MutS family protein, partial [Prevotella sp.]|nr:Smr/MutS family protein [Prevotella sp.]